MKAKDRLLYQKLYSPQLSEEAKREDARLMAEILAEPYIEYDKEQRRDIVKCMT